MNKTVAILGCGWLGLPLARVMAEAGYRVHGSSTSPEKQEEMATAGIRPYLILVGESGVEGPMDGFLKGIDVLIINIPPGLRTNTPGSFLRKMEVLYRATKASGLRHVLFVSSTSVYGEVQGEITEETPPLPRTDSGRELLEAENLFISDPRLKTIVVRPGGLIGPGRHPVTRLSGRNGLRNGSDPVNLIQQADLIHLIRTVIEDGHWQKIFNAVYPAHPPKREYYSREAIVRQLSPPEYDPPEPEMPGKRVISKLFLANKYSFFSSIYS